MFHVCLWMPVSLEDAPLVSIVEASDCNAACKQAACIPQDEDWDDDELGYACQGHFDTMEAALQFDFPKTHAIL